MRVSVGTFVLFAVTSLAASGQAQTPPNVVLILADDLGWADLSCHGSTFYETPHIDALAARSVRFRAAYANAPNCAPTRACLMSGLYPPRHGVYTVGSGARGKAANRRMVPAPNQTELAPRFATLAERLHDANYATCHVGKWHLGSPGEHGPREQGFDVNVGGFHAGHPKSYFAPYQNPELADGETGEHLTSRLAAEATRFIAAEREQPFFLYYAPYAVHTPIQAKPEIAARYRDKPPHNGQKNPKYAAMVQSLDEAVGSILATLEEIGKRDNTIVIFTSDNGGFGGYPRELRTAGVTDNAPLRGGKGMLYEGGVRVPLFVDAPNSQSRDVDVPVLLFDLYPTLTRWAGAECGEVDGTDLTAALRGQKFERGPLFFHFPGYLQANARQGTWRTTPAGAIRDGRFKLIEWFETGAVELYDLDADPSEREDLAESAPEQRDRLLTQLRRWRDKTNAPMPEQRR